MKKNFYFVSNSLLINKVDSIKNLIDSYSMFLQSNLRCMKNVKCWNLWMIRRMIGIVYQYNQVDLERVTESPNEP
jgi:hypothetical protein